MTQQTIPDLIFAPRCPFCGADLRYEDDAWICQDCYLVWDSKGFDGSRVDNAPACDEVHHPFAEHYSPILRAISYRCVLEKEHASSDHQGVRWRKDRDPDLEDVYTWSVA